MLEAIKVPEIGENVESGTVVAVHVQVDQQVAVDDTVIELETDKALVEIPSPFNGKITEVLAEEGAQMNVGDVIARVETDATGESAAPKQETPAEAEPRAQTEAETAPAESPAPKPKPAAKPEAPEPEAPAEPAAETRPPAPAAPSIRRLARELGVDIHAVTGSGPGGRIREADVKAFVRDGGSATTAPVVGAGGEPTLPDFGRWGQVEFEPIDTVRRLTAQSTAVSWTTVPHVTQYDEADLTAVNAFIAKHAKRAQKAGAKLTVTAVLTRVCAEALARFWRFNASIDVTNGRIIRKHYVHIGIAADTPRGLLVPVVRDADKKGIIDLALAIGDLAERARNKRIKPDELEGGTFSISNQGGIGGVGFTPIVLWPQVAILGVSRSSVKPVYNGQDFEPRTILPLSLSYDHRIIDGADAARFLRWICETLENPLTLLLD